MRVSSDKEKDMKKIVPAKLAEGDEIRIIAPSRGTKIIAPEVRKLAEDRMAAMGLKVTYAENATDENWDMLGTTAVEKRVQDITDAFKDPKVKGIFTIIGGFNSNQLLPYLDYALIQANPKVLCGFSDITALLNAVYAKTGLETYSGPHLSSLGMLKGAEFTIENMRKMLFTDEPNNVVPSNEWSDDLWFLNQEQREFIQNDGYWVINPGDAEGTIIGGNLGTFNLLLGSEYRPAFEADTILFAEDTGASDIADFMRNLTALTYQPDFKNVKALVIGRFQKDSKVTREQIAYMVKSVEPLSRIPVLANVDFGHSTPLLTIPVGGTARLNRGKLSLQK